MKFCRIEKSLTVVFYLISLCPFAREGRIDSLTSKLSDEISLEQTTLNIQIANEYVFQDPAKALNYARKAESLALKISDTKELIEAREIIATLYRNMGEYKRSIEINMETIRLSEEMDYGRGEVMGYTSLGVNYDFLGNYELAEKYYNQGLEITIRIDHKKGEAILYNNLAILEYFKGNHEKELSYFLKAGEIYTEIKDTIRLSDIYNNLANYYTNVSDEEDRLERAEKYIDQAIELKKRVTDKKGLSTSYLNMAIIWDRRDDYEKANQYLDKGYQLAKELNWNFGMRAYYERKYSYAEKRDQLDTAFKYLKQYMIVKDSILNEENNKQIGILSAVYETERKEQQIASLELEKQNEIIKRNTYLVGLIGAGCSIAFIVFWFRYRIRKNRQLREKEIQQYQSALDGYTDRLIEKSSRIEELNQELEKVKEEISSGCPTYDGALDSLMQSTILTSDEWMEFKKLFNQVHTGFLSNVRIKYPDLTETEERLMALTKLNLNNKEIASMLGISLESVNKSRYRLRKKLNIPSGEMESIVAEL